jgi:hypothetical protein
LLIVHFRPPFPPLHLPQAYHASPSAQIQALCTFNDIMSNSQIIIILKLKLTIHFNNVIISPNLLILPSLASSARIGSRSVYLIPVHSFNLLRSIFSPWLVSIQKIRSHGDCEGMSFSGSSPTFSFDLFGWYQMDLFHSICTFHLLSL